MNLVDNWRRLRKSTLFLFGLLLIYLVYRIVLMLNFSNQYTNDDVFQNSVVNQQFTYTLCDRVVDGKPFGYDSIYTAFNDQVAFYTQSKDKIDSLKHIWYLENSVIQIKNCSHQDSICVSYIKPKNLASGLWSVDVVRGNKLYGSTQFSVNEKSESK